MAFLRFSRDKKGYEHFYLIQPSNRGRARQRVLYWFRTPPNVRVGRGALDEGAIRSLEEQNPEISFDWTKILEAQPRRTRRRRGSGMLGEPSGQHGRPRGVTGPQLVAGPV